ncbi:MAG: type II secretion system protein [Phycisphaerae bacterium]|nr:type II secretion system protein [Phycisphaerae bacterium]
MSRSAQEMTSVAGTAERVGGPGVPARVAGGFTLVELLVAALAVAIITVGVASVFRVTGETVASGKRLSSVTQYAAAIERQMRADFASMSRDGFLMIRNSGADADADGQYIPGTTLQPGPDAVRLHAGDQNPRGRRTDEIVFFAKGEFSTLREPRHPDRVARAREARIYYGHGNRRSIPQGFELPFIELDDANTLIPGSSNPAFGLGVDSPLNPDRFASEWLLLRHVTLLTAPSNVEQNTLLVTGAVSPSLAALIPERLRDSDYQVALQPASPHIFRRLSALVPIPTLNQAARPAFGAGGAIETPHFSSGVVDIATTSLSEIRTIVHSAPDPLTLGAINVPNDSTFERELAKRFVPFVAGRPAETQNLNTLSPTSRMQAWMMQALPADSDGIGANRQPDPVLRRRMRAEPTPPNYLGLPAPDIQQDYDRADQLMLSASVFVPRCTEFIVEWTFGEVESIDQQTLGRTVWYGQERVIDAAQDGSPPPAPGQAPTGGNFVNYTIRPFTGADAPVANLAANHPYFTQKQQTVTRRDGSTFTRPIARNLITPDPAFDRGRRYDPRTPTGILEPVYSCFGYVDPTYIPATPAPFGGPLPVLQDGQPVPRGWVLTTDVNGNGRFDRGAGDVAKPALLVDVNKNGSYDAVDGDVLLEPETAPWPWPTMIRVTMSVADPNDPSQEFTFQFILPVAKAPKGSAF